MVGWHHRLSGHEIEQTLRDSEGKGNLACCSPWGFKESDTMQQLKNNETGWAPTSPGESDKEVNPDGMSHM